MLRKLIPHICIILTLFTITFIIINEFNNDALIISAFFKATLIVFCVATLVASGFLIGYNRRS